MPIKNEKKKQKKKQQQQKTGTFLHLCWKPNAEIMQEWYFPMKATVTGINYIFVFIDV